MIAIGTAEKLIATLKRVLDAKFSSVEYIRARQAAREAVAEAQAEIDQHYRDMDEYHKEEVREGRTT